MSKKADTKRKPLLHDAQIVNRVRKCLEAKTDKDFEFGYLVRKVQATYPEYKRRKQGPFRQLVKQALRIVNQNKEQSNSKLSSESETEDVNTSQKVNVMSSLLNNMYNKVRVPKQNGRGSGDAISISSEESQENPCGEYNSSQNDCRRSINSSSRSSINSLNLDVVLSPMSEGPSTCPSVIVGQKRPESSPTEGNPPKKLMTHHRRSQDVEQAQEEYAKNPNEAVDNPVEDNANNGQNNESKTKKETIRTFKKPVKMEISIVKFHHLGGIEKLLKELCQILIHIKSPEIYNRLGVLPPKGILIYGTSGSGKTCLAYAIAGQLQIPIINVPATELIAGVTGESEERIRDIFEQAKAASPCVLFIDDVEAISVNRMYAQKEMERRVVSQLISCMDNLTQNGGNVLIIGATTHPDCLDAALRRAGRFDHEIAIPLPNRKERREILRIMCDGLRVEPNFDYDEIAGLTPGYVGADISALVSRASLFAVKRKFLEQLYDVQGQPLKPSSDLQECDEYSTSNENTNSSSSYKNSPTRPRDPMVINIDPIDEEENADENVLTEDVLMLDPLEPCNVNETESMPLRNNWKPTLAQMIDCLNAPIENMNLENFFLTFSDFTDALKVLQPSAKREGFLTVPNVSWNDVGSLQDIREELRLTILAPVKFSHEIARLGLTAPSGVLLCGPPGCGKTLIAKAVANEAGINFLSVKGPELMNMYVGESERAVRDCFQRAKNAAPCVIFFDEFDSLCPKRSDTAEGSSGIRVVNQLLTEMDGVEDRKGVYIMAASNRPDIIDPAILRPGRLDTILYVGIPNEYDRIDILKAATKDRLCPLLADDVNFAVLAQKTDKFTGADLSGLVRKASMQALKDAIENQPHLESVLVTMKHFNEALELVRPSISSQDLNTYEKMRLKYAAPRYAA